MIPRETIDRIMSVAIIEDVIGEFVSLKKSGTSYRGLSPFTNEKTPSFFVVPHKGIFKCFSSGKGGNVVNFLMEHEKCSYPEALRWLAGKYNIEIEEVELSDDQKEAQTARESLSIVTKFAAEYFEKTLWESEAGKSIGLSYLKERGLRDDIIKKFRIGYCLDEWDGFTKSALEAGYEKKFLLKSGLTKENNGKPFDFFKGRVMFPIRDISGKVIAFGGRTLRSDKKVAKYYNSPESELYHKSRVLYGIHLAKAAMVKQDLCYLVEGYTDVISLHQNEVENVVASAGTSLTDDQIGIIKRYTQNVTLLFDGDPAGIRASFRGIDMLLKQGLNVRVVPFPDGEDPDSFARKTPSGEFQEFLEKSSVDFLVFKSQTLSEDAGDDPIKRAQLIGDIVDSIVLIPDAIKRSVYTQECSRLLHVAEETLIAEINKRFRKQYKKATGYAPVVGMEVKPEQKAVTEKVDSLKYQEQDFIRLLLMYGNKMIETEVQIDGEDQVQEISVAHFLIGAIDADKISFENPVYNQIIIDFRKSLNESSPLGEAHFATHFELEVTKVVAEILSTRYTLSPNWEKHKIYPETEEMLLPKAVKDSIFKLKLVKVRNLITEIQEQIKQAKDDEKVVYHLISKNQILNKAKQELSLYSGSVIIE